MSSAVPVCSFDDTLVAVQVTDVGEQRILVQGTAQGGNLARLLAGVDELAMQSGYFVVPHEPAVDHRLRVLVDTLITIRWSHPTYTQLPLQLDGGEE